MDLLIPLIVVGALLLLVVSAYNGLVNGRNRVDEALGQIQVQLKRRYDLIPNLVEAVKGQMGFERSVLQRAHAAVNLPFAVLLLKSFFDDVPGAVGEADLSPASVPKAYAAEKAVPLVKRLEDALSWPRVSTLAGVFSGALKNDNKIRYLQQSLFEAGGAEYRCADGAAAAAVLGAVALAVRRTIELTRWGRDIELPRALDAVSRRSSSRLARSAVKSSVRPYVANE